MQYQIGFYTEKHLKGPSDIKHCVSTKLLCRKNIVDIELQKQQ